MNIQERLKNLKELVEFKQDEFIFVQIFQRRKDNPDLELSVKRLKSYSFYSWEELEKQIPRIEEICDLNNTRAYIRLNKQNAVDVSLRCITEMAEDVINENKIVVRRPNRDFLLSIRNGEKSYEEIMEYVESKVYNLDKLFDESNLPDFVDKTENRELLKNIRLENISI